MIKLSINLVAKLFRQRNRKIRARLLALPTSVPSLTGKQRAALKRSINKVLRELSRETFTETRRG